MNRTEYLLPNQVPAIPENLNADQLHLLIPTGFEDLITYYVENAETNNPSLVIKFLNPENPDNSTVTIPQTMFNPERAGVESTKFLFEKSTSTQDKVDYFGKDSNLRLNLNQCTYLLIQHQMVYYVRTLEGPFGRRKQYVNLLTMALSKLRHALIYIRPNAYNAVKKAQNTYTIISYDFWNNPSIPYGDNWKFASPTNETHWNKILSDLQDNLRLTTETSLANNSKLVLVEKGKTIYRNVGHKELDGHIISIFPSKANIPARCKTHTLSNGYEIAEEHLPHSCIVENIIAKDGVVKPLDKTGIPAIVVFSPMDYDTGRYVAGEGNISRKMAKTLVYETKTYSEFLLEETITVEEGKTYVADFKPFVLGRNIEGHEVTIFGAKDIEIIHISTNPTTGIYSIKVRYSRYVSNGRFVSNTGIKTVTSCSPKLGHIFLLNKGYTRKDLPKHIQQILNGESNVQEIFPNELDKYATRINPDLIIGMGSAKAGANSIRLAQAELAVHTNSYIPLPKGKNGEYEGLISSLDAKEVNDCADSLPDFIYLNRFNVPQDVHIGRVFLKVTELGSTYAEWKMQTVPFELMRIFKEQCIELYNHIQETYIDPEKLEITKQCYTILNDKKCVLAFKEEQGLRFLDVSAIQKLLSAKDLMLSMTTVYPVQSKLLDDEFNSKGLVLDYRKYKGPLIRLPSASVLRSLVSKRPSGEYAYHQVLVNISKIINATLGIVRQDETASERKSYKPRLSWIWNMYGDAGNKTYLYDQYMKSIEGLVFKTDENGEMVANCLIKPQVPGLGLKQVLEPLLPNDVIVIGNKKLYRKICKQTGYEHLNDEYSASSLAMEVALNRCDDNTFNEETSEKALKLLEDVPEVLTIRHPFLM